MVLHHGRSCLYGASNRCKNILDSINNTSYQKTSKSNFLSPSPVPGWPRELFRHQVSQFACTQVLDGPLRTLLCLFVSKFPGHSLDEHITDDNCHAIQKLLRFGVDGIMTDRPRRVRRVIGETKKRGESNCAAPTPDDDHDAAGVCRHCQWPPQDQDQPHPFFGHSLFHISCRPLRLYGNMETRPLTIKCQRRETT